MDQNGEHKKPGNDNVQEPSRRKFLVNTGFAIGGVVVGGALGALLGKKSKGPAAPAPAPETGKPAGPANYNRALMFLTPEQFAIVEAATERIFPKDDNGPGAKELGVAFFIDHQLAGDWGFNAREYMSPPYFKGEKVQGYQGHLKRREMYDIALQEMENYSHSQYQKGFAQLSGEQQDEILKAFEDNTVQLGTISPSGFFRVLRSSTLEGVYSDPLYGGNANMEGWRMRNYPGNQMSYTSIIDKDFQIIAPSSLQDHMAAH
ncbi:gluconate 2-dehydrogenase subunit 3 family protein [Paenibacillus sp. GCM10027626]|uniref:gluconate 2-dehydrogenase subunit 3 family protein n=1 Tax=Paenibacillus sp. GCM10027626 TaxID=3273411 RepID=UPI00362E27E5